MSELRSKYRSVAMANAFGLFQKYGPDGKDGIKGTIDDLRDPLASVACSPPADVDAVFTTTLVGLASDREHRRARGVLYLYWGKPGLALKEFAQRYDETPVEQKALDEAIDDLVIALRAYCGHTVAGERFLAYQKLGPKGRDGKQGTADDLSDPLSEILKSLPHPKSAGRGK